MKGERPQGEDERAARQVCENFTLPRPTMAVRSLAAEPEAGNIHQSWVVTCGKPSRGRYLLQRINTAVFPDAERLMDNVVAVTAHMRSRLVAEGADPERGTLEVVPTVEGRFLWWRNGTPWRCYRFVERSRSRPVVTTAEGAYQVGTAYGRFQRLLVDMDPQALAVTIPHFHDPAGRLDAFTDALSADRVGRGGSARAEIDELMSHASLAEQAGPASLSTAVRITHNDCKVSNVLFDTADDRALCVVDLDTVMPGRLVWDFGDMVRSATCPVGEDEVDLTRVACDPGLFDGLCRGYLAQAEAFIDETERRWLGLAGALVTFEQALRFLTDYLDGDRYYRVSHPSHNLDRARAQLRLLTSILDQERHLSALVQRAWADRSRRSGAEPNGGR